MFCNLFLLLQEKKKVFIFSVCGTSNIFNFWMSSSHLINLWLRKTGKKFMHFPIIYFATGVKER